MTSQSANVRPLWVKLSVVTVTASIVCCLVLLGNWQMQRLSWKLNLIEQVKNRAYSTPVSPPQGSVTAKEHAYTRVLVSGIYQHQKTILVKAVTELGLGYWVMTPLLSNGRAYWVNRGFIPNKLKASKQWNKPTTDQPVIGLLRVSEPKGSLLEKNDPVNNRWYSRDVSAMSEASDINTAPYFIDLEGSLKDWPRAGMTTLKFRNSHLPYALTWYAMAVMLAGAGIWFVREL